MLRRLAHAFACAAAIAPLLVASTLVGPRAAAAQPAAQQAAAQQRAAQRSARTDPPALAAIRQDALRRDVFAMAADSMRGREAGTLDELRAAVSLADRAREAGLAPAGDDGSYLQWWPMRRIRPAATSRVLLDGQPVVLWQDAAVVAPIDAARDVPLVWVGAASADSLRRLDLRGRAVAALVVPPSRPPVSWVSLRAWRYARLAVAERAAALQAAGAVAAVLVADDSTDAILPTFAVQMRRGSYAVDSAGAERPATTFPVVFVAAAQRARVAAATRLALDLRAESFVYPSVNVVARVPGRDAALRGEYVLFSSHVDHDGVRNPVSLGDDARRGVTDSVWHGADDNASVSAALLAIGRAFTRAPGRRSALFVWHGAEERGLLGSRWYAAHPTVPREAIAAVLNADMIGRNAPDSAALLGAQPPHRNSTELVRMALDANARVTRFALDTVWDRPTHPEGWYFRSDHLPYARAGVPALMFSTLLHADYHTPADRAERIDYAKLTRMTRWMYATGWAVAEADRRPGLDPGFRLER
jgi:hypothetical protein